MEYIFGHSTRIVYEIKRKSNPCFGWRSGDWECGFDLPEFREPGTQYIFPHEVLPTNLRCDGHIISRSKKVCFVVEPMDLNVDGWHRDKKIKYEESLSGAKGWTIHY